MLSKGFFALTLFPYQFTVSIVYDDVVTRLDLLRDNQTRYGLLDISSYDSCYRTCAVFGRIPLFARCCNASSDKFNWMFSVSSVVLAIFQMEVEYLFGDIFIYWRKRNHLGETSQNSGRKYCAITSMSFPESGVCPDCICSTIHWLPILDVKMIMEFEKSPSRPSLSCILPSSIICRKTS